ncbi:type II toxin-antitoxin system RelE/ParE family toxin [Lonepinella sp. MS14436]|uniref:type II toxin-antitoxin system RelE/ParE family toxin n=1 Tax=Lonepinella sp. MS14436 TaxID=3003619 RepID=UPI0036DBF118
MSNQEKVNQLKKTGLFLKWFNGLKDPIGKSAIIKRIERAEKGNFGDHKSVGDGVFEMRIAVKSGYRVYYGKMGDKIYLLLCGGNKSSQEKDIALAKDVWNLVKQKEKADDFISK